MISGKTFHETYKEPVLKILNKAKKQNGFIYNDGINVLKTKFNTNAVSGAGGLYACFKENLQKWMKYLTDETHYIAKVTFPDDAKVIVMKSQIKADKIHVTISPFWTIETFELLGWKLPNEDLPIPPGCMSTKLIEYFIINDASKYSIAIRKIIAQFPKLITKDMFERMLNDSFTTGHYYSDGPEKHFIIFNAFPKKFRTYKNYIRLIKSFPTKYPKYKYNDIVRCIPPEFLRGELLKLITDIDYRNIVLLPWNKVTTKMCEDAVEKGANIRGNIPRCFVTKNLCQLFYRHNRDTNKIHAIETINSIYPKGITNEIMKEVLECCFNDKKSSCNMALIINIAMQHNRHLLNGNHFLQYIEMCGGDDLFHVMKYCSKTFIDNNIDDFIAKDYKFIRNENLSIEQWQSVINVNIIHLNNSKCPMSLVTYDNVLKYVKKTKNYSERFPQEFMNDDVIDLLQ